MLMAGWSTLKDGSDLDLCDIEIAQSFDELWFDLEFSLKDCNVDGCNERLRSLFDEVRLLFLREVSGEECVKPTPALLGDGQPLDLFRLFWVVWKWGGYDSVSQDGLWPLVVEECGLDGGLVASVKLVHLKYLNELDQWLRAVIRDMRMGSGEGELGGKLSLLLLELQKEFRCLMGEEKDVKKEDAELTELEWTRNGTCNDLSTFKRKLLLPATRDINEAHFNAKKTISDDDEKFPPVDENEVVVSSMNVAKQASTSQKRKRESPSLSGMLNWVIGIAKYPDNLAIGRLPECSKWKDYSNDELWVQALLARKALLTGHHAHSDTEESFLRKKQKMHPSMYEDSGVLRHKSAVKLRCSERLPLLTKHRSCYCCSDSSSATHNKVASTCKAELENCPKEEALPGVEILGKDEIDDMPNDEPLEKCVSVGPLFQAEVPEWTGVVAESDSRWLGTRMWPPENGKHKSLIEMDPSGKGRHHPCSCEFPGSVGCVRFHIAEKRMELKLELGSLFYNWRFDRMGEEVALSWTNEEEKRFQDIVASNPPSLSKRFWDNALKFFPTKTKENLVSYYFNVFLVQRRRYQNQVTPEDVDSDDEESKFGCVGLGYGYEALRVPRSKLPVCSENKQCTDF